MTAAAKGLPVSVHVRLVRHAKAIGADPNFVLGRFAVERFLHRLSRSRHADRFVLKGALLMLVWLGETIEVEPDGLEYLSSSLRVAPIRQDDAYGGLRATLQARLGNARLRMQIDVGIGDAVTPAPEWLEYPSLLDLPRPRLRAYRPETSIAEKLHAMVQLGEANSRMRDFFDIDALSQQARFDGDPLAEAVRATFERRRMPIPESLPLALTPEFAAIRGKQVQWQGFLRKNRLAAPEELGVVVARIATFLGPAIAAARNGMPLPLAWPPGGPWAPVS
jgi:hypothetical protein